MVLGTVLGTRAVLSIKNPFISIFYLIVVAERESGLTACRRRPRSPAGDYRCAAPEIQYFSRRCPQPSVSVRPKP